MTEFDLISYFFETGKHMNFGIFPNVVMVEYGYSYINNEFVLYIKGSNEDNNFIRNYIEKDKEAHFYKFLANGEYIIGNGSVKILETKEEKINGLKMIIKQQFGTNEGLTFDENALNDILIVMILVENYDIIK